MATAPTYASNPRTIDHAAIGTANTNRDGTGTIVLVSTGSAAGFRVQSIEVQPTVTTTTGMVRLFLSTDSGTTWQLYDELPMAAMTVSATQPAARTARLTPNLVLFGVTNCLGASTEKGEAMHVWAMGADL